MSIAVVFRCSRSGKSTLIPWRDELAWARVAGFGHIIEWAADINQVESYEMRPARGKDFWLRLKTPPITQSEYVLRVSSPVTIYNQPFWVWFEPELSFLNGWDDQPEEIALSCLVKLELIEVLKHQGSTGWIKAQVLDVLKLEDLVERFPENNSGKAAPYLNWMIPDSDGYAYTRVDWEEFSYIGVSPREGGAHAWVICRREEQFVRLLVYGESDLDRNGVFAGNRLLTMEEWQLLSNSDK
jgi:hypothetical protein